jgi:hypothetical protein
MWGEIVTKGNAKDELLEFDPLLRFEIDKGIDDKTWMSREPEERKAQIAPEPEDIPNAGDFEP